MCWSPSTSSPRSSTAKRRATTRGTPPGSSGRRSRRRCRTTSRRSRWSPKAPTSTRNGRSKLSDAAAITGDAHGHHPDLQHHFDTLEQQHEAATLGMWLFLVTEVLFFGGLDRKSTRLNSSHSQISYAVFCLKKKTNTT